MYESQIGSPGRQNFDAGELNCDVCPISQTNEFGASSTSPQPSALPSCCTSNDGMSGPSFFAFSTIVPASFVVMSLTVT